MIQVWKFGALGNWLKEYCQYEQNEGTTSFTVNFTKRKKCIHQPQIATLKLVNVGWCKSSCGFFHHFQCKNRNYFWANLIIYQMVLISKTKCNKYNSEC